MNGEKPNWDFGTRLLKPFSIGPVNLEY